MELHQVHNTKRGGSTDSSHAVHQSRSMLLANAVDLVGNAVEVKGEWGMGQVCHWHLDILHLRPVGIGDLHGGVNNAGDALGQDQVAVGSCIPTAQVEEGGDLCNPTQHPSSH